MVAATGALGQEGEREEGRADDQPRGPAVTVQEVHVRKNRPDEVFHRAGTSVTFRVHDDAGTDLAARHEDEIVAWREKVARLREEGHFVSMGRSRELYEAEGPDPGEGVSGFYLTVESWALPPAEATSLRVEGDYARVATSVPAVPTSAITITIAVIHRFM